MHPARRSAPPNGTASRLSRRQALSRLAAATAVGWTGPRLLRATEKAPGDHQPGVISGEPSAEKVGARVLAAGGNAVDAVVAGALTAAVTSPHLTGIGGYGGSMTLALAGTGKVTCIDFNSTAPLAARADMFPPDGEGGVRDRVNEFGWLAAGVPGVLAGLQLARDRYGSRPLGELLAPAIAFARAGFPAGAGMIAGVKASAAQFRADAGSRKLFFKDDQLVSAGQMFRNPDLAVLLETLAQRGSVDSFYRGDIAQRIAGAFQKNGGLVTAQDLAAYRALEVEPLAFAWRGFEIRTAPLTAGGLTVLQALAILRALKWDEQPAGLARTHARLEALRFAWHDRLSLLGDPAHASVPVARLLSGDYAREAAAQIGRVVKEGKILPLQTESRPQPGTVHLSAADRHGNLVACTLTHGGAFGARVTVEGLGLTLGHGVSRFEPRPGHPNSVGPGKRPLHNMCPTIVLRDARPVLALGGRGGRKIPNAAFEVLTQFVALGKNLDDAVAAPRLHTEGNASLELEKAWPADDAKALTALGYQVKTAASATISAVTFDPATGLSRSKMR